MLQRFSLQSMKKRKCIGVVPVTWGLEVANVLVGAVRQERLTQEKMENIQVQLTKLPFVSDSGTYRHVLNTNLTLAQKDSLKVNDASFLELAQRLGVPPGTYDDDLAKTAASQGVTVFPTPAAELIHPGSSRTSSVTRLPFAD